MKERILVVDDTDLNRRLTSDLLERNDVPDLILMDIQLPGMDGLTLTRQLKADRRFQGVPIVAMTAFAMKGDAEKALQAGCIGYITKPIDTRRLPAQVAEFLTKRVRETRQMTVMIVEDHRIDLKLAGESVQLRGHVVLGNTSAEQAIENLEREHPDVVLLDLNLPGMDGLSFVRLLKSNPKTRDVPVVAVTAYSDEYRRKELLEAGCVAYVVKPFDINQLMNELEKASMSPRR